jgi:hypothetical protein
VRWETRQATLAISITHLTLDELGKVEQTVLGTPEWCRKEREADTYDFERLDLQSTFCDARG